MKNIYSLLILSLITIQLKGNAIKTLDSLINISGDISKMDQRFFDNYISALNQITSSRRLIYSQKGISLADKTKNDDFSAIMIQDLALYYASIDSVKIATRLTKQAYNLAQSNKNKRSLAGYIAIYASIQSHYQTAIEYYLKEIEWCDKLENNKLKGAPYNNIAELFLELKRYDKAKEYALKAYNLDVRTIPEKRFIAYGATIIGQIYQATGQLDSAEYYYKEAVNISRNRVVGLSDTRFFHIQSHVYYHLSRFYRETGQDVRALLNADTAKVNLKNISDLAFEYSIYIYSNLAKCYLNLDRHVEAEESIQQIEAKIKNGATSYPLQQLFYEYKVAYALKTENFKAAYRYEATLKDLQEKISANEKEQFILLSLEASNQKVEATFEEEEINNLGKKIS